MKHQSHAQFTRAIAHKIEYVSWKSMKIIAKIYLELFWGEFGSGSS
jgi:hypothetical protein